jgi:hypothetical protein
MKKLTNKGEEKARKQNTTQEKRKTKDLLSTGLQRKPFTC